jgi:hypothetical protein
MTTSFASIVGWFYAKLNNFYSRLLNPLGFIIKKQETFSAVAGAGEFRATCPHHANTTSASRCKIAAGENRKDSLFLVKCKSTKTASV